MPGATAPFVDGGEILRFQLLLQCVFRLETFDDINNTAPSHKFADDGGADSLRLAWHHRDFFYEFFYLHSYSFRCRILEDVYTRPCAELTIHIGERWLVAWHFEKSVRNPNLVLFFRRGLETETLDVGFH
jgi:hypothetical protein